MIFLKNCQFYFLISIEYDQADIYSQTVQIWSLFYSIANLHVFDQFAVMKKISTSIDANEI